MNTISTPVIILNISPAIWSEVPLPEAAKLSLPGLLFASAMNSATDFAGTEGFTTMTFGMRAIIAVAARSFSKLKVRFVYRVSLIACAAVACNLVCRLLLEKKKNICQKIILEDRY